MIRSLQTAFMAVILTAALAGCGAPSEASDDAATEESTVADGAPVTEDAAPTPTPTASATAEAGWSGLHDPATQAKLKAQVDKFFNDYNAGPFELMFVDSFSGNDHALSAGKLAFEKGAPAIVIAIDQREIFFVGDETFRPAFTDPTTKAMAAKFDKGDYTGGIDVGLDAIFKDWGFE
ncbi:TPM domain-containing protein [Citromicrobium bathyomarinum]|uniref:TPM domain-containing protein n=1 Tax=Citromicrobium bathyomarinum TaxID=72174 RepID=UPI003159DF78